MAAFKALSIKSSSLFSGYTHCVRPALSAVGELGDVDTGPGAQRLQERPGWGPAARKSAWGMSGMRFMTAGLRTGGPTGDSPHLPADCRDDDGVDFHRKSGFCVGHVPPSGEKGCHGSGMAAHRPADVPGTDDGAWVLTVTVRVETPQSSSSGKVSDRTSSVGAQAEQEARESGRESGGGSQGGGVGQGLAGPRHPCHPQTAVQAQARSTRSRQLRGDDLRSDAGPGLPAQSYGGRSSRTDVVGSGATGR